MNREVKFKGLDEYGEWVFGMPTLRYNNKLFIQEFDSGYNQDGTEIYEETLCQFTGLKDKNGVEIYEGDEYMYVGTAMSSGTVVFKDGCFMGEGPFNTLPLFQLMNADDFDFIEVTGNIYDDYEG